MLTFRSTSSTDLDGTLTWTKGKNPADPFYPGGFSTLLPVAGSLYVRPVAGLQAMTLSRGAATAGFGAGNLAQPLDVPVSLNQPNKVTMTTPGLPDLTLSINPVSGAMSGTFDLPDGNVPRGVYGVIFQKQNSAFGCFRGLNQSGYFSLTQ